jgi:hypothetical protein
MDVPSGSTIVALNKYATICNQPVILNNVANISKKMRHSKVTGNVLNSKLIFLRASFETNEQKAG